MVIDTHVFIWYAAGDARLPSPIRSKMEADPDSVWVPSICIWEALLLAERGKLTLQGKHPERTIRAMLKASSFREAPLTSEIAILSRTLAFQHNDPADRFIAATAKALGQPLATSDARLRALRWIKLAY